MATQIDIGDKSATQPDFIEIDVRPGDTININVLSGDTLNVYTNFDQAPTSTITAGNNTNFSNAGTLFLQSQGVSSVLVTGGIYT